MAPFMRLKIQVCMAGAASSVTAPQGSGEISAVQPVTVNSTHSIQCLEQIWLRRWPVPFRFESSPHEPCDIIATPMRSKGRGEWGEEVQRFSAVAISRPNFPRPAASRFAIASKSWFETVGLRYAFSLLHRPSVTHASASSEHRIRSKAQGSLFGHEQ